METSTVKVLSDAVKIISESLNTHNKAILTLISCHSSLKERVDEIERKQNEKTDDERN